MTRSYKLINEFKQPYHDGDEHVAMVRVYDIDEDTYDFLYNVQCYERDDGFYGPHNPAPDDICEACSVTMTILEDLGLTHNGEVYKTYDATMWCRMVMVVETIARNI